MPKAVGAGEEGKPSEVVDCGPETASDSRLRRRGLRSDEQNCTLDSRAVGGPYPYDRPDLKADNFGGHWQLLLAPRPVQRSRKGSWLEKPPADKVKLYGS